LCVQGRLACSAGDRPAGVRVRSPVAWIAGWRETKTLKPIDGHFLGECASHRAVTKVNVEVASKMKNSEGRACNRKGEGSMGSRNSDRYGYSTSAGWKRRHDDKDMLSNWRSPPRPGAKSQEQGRPSITGEPGKWAEGERVADGFAVAMKPGNAGGAKEPCCL